MAAKADSGIWFSTPGMSITNASSKTPCIMAAIFVLPPEATFAELRTITEVTGRPPINPATILPTPCAINSRLGGEMRL